MKATIIKAKPEDHEELTKISALSKRHWGYPEEYFTIWEEDLMVAPEYIDKHEVYNLVIAGKIIGFCSVEQKEGLSEITHLWIIPEYIGKGLGTKLLRFVLEKIVVKGQKVTLVAERKAEGFYHKHGFVTIDEIQGKIPHRKLPYMVNYNFPDEEIDEEDK